MILTGQFSIRRDREESRSRIELFSIRIPADTSAPKDILRAHDLAWRDLAELIAKTL